MPRLRPGPPWAMAEAIAAEPALAERIRQRLLDDGSAAALADAVRAAAAAGQEVIVTGCGTSEHAALATAEVLRDAWRAAGLPGRGPVSAQAFELAQDPPAGGLVIGISHEGGTAATIAALDASRSRGARTALVTASPGAPAAAAADLVLATVELDTSWCHTVGYVSPIVAAIVTAGLLAGTPPAAGALRARVAEGIEAAHASDGARLTPRPLDRPGDRRRVPPARRRVRRGPGDGPRADAQGRGGRVRPVRDARPGDLPPRPPAGHRRVDRARARAARPRGAGRPGASRPPGPRRGRCGRDPLRGHPRRGGRRRDPRRAHPGGPDRGPRGVRRCPTPPRRCWAAPARSSS